MKYAPDKIVLELSMDGQCDYYMGFSARRPVFGVCEQHLPKLASSEIPIV